MQEVQSVLNIEEDISPFPNGTFFFKRRVFGFLRPQSTAFRTHQALGFGHWYNSHCWEFEDI